MKKLHRPPEQVPSRRYPKRPRRPEELGRQIINVRRSLRNAVACSTRLCDMLEAHGFDPSNPWAIQAGCLRDAVQEALTWHVDLVNLVSGSDGKPPENGAPRGHLKSQPEPTEERSEGEPHDCSASDHDRDDD